MSSNAFQFSIRRLVLVDSAGFCYVELPVDTHAVLLGTGNLGKSSLLNSLRLFLLPESNFRNSRKKFAFRNASAGSHYSNEESYQHYFPGQYSFLIMEVENPMGVHCQILYRDKASELSFGRIFVPVPYSELRPLFWDGDGDADGIGRAVSGLSFARVSAAVKKLSSETVFTSDTGKLRNMLYSSDLMSADAVRYSVLPLADRDERKVQSLRTLILLLFEMKADDRAMADAVASIIEADKKFADDAFDFDIDQFLLRHETLKQQHAHLTRIDAQSPRFQALSEAYRRYGEMASSQSDFAAFRDGLGEALARAREEHQQANETRMGHKEALKQITTQVTALGKSASELDGEIRAHQRMLTEAESTQQKGELLIARYAGMSMEEIRDILTEDLDESDAQLKAFKSADQAVLQKQRLTEELARLDAQLEDLAQRQKNRQWQLHRQLDRKVAGPLEAIDNRLVLASPGEALDDSTLETLRAFTALLEKKDDGYWWFDTRFDHRPLKELDLEGETDRLKTERNSIARRLGDLDGESRNAQDLPRKIEQLEKEIAALTGDLKLLERLPGAKSRLTDAAEAIRLAEEQRAELALQQAAEQEKQGIAEEQFAQSQAVVRRLGERETELLQMNRTVGSQRKRFPSLASATAETPLPAPELSVTRLDEIVLTLEQVADLRQRILGDLRDFVREGILEDASGSLQQDSPTSSAIRERFVALTEVFAEVREQEEVLREQVLAHNETVASYRHALKANYEHIRRFENQLNSELDGVAINDLVEIRVDIHTHPKFRNLVEESEGIDPYSDQLQSDAFYDRLRVFVAEFFNEESQGNRLTMDRVITGVAYRTRKQDAKELDRKGQSTSTTALINLELVHRLLRRVLYNSVSLSFPMVLDELASVDVSQVPALLARLKSQGFNLFSAATHSASPEVIYQVGRHMEVGLMRTAHPYDARRTLVFWGGAEGFSREGESGAWLDQEQSALWDTVHE
ncbi:MAG: hypothetical protein EA349_13650 [Halomonadaceae bacterium]|nr:MAG: hypothetical protein EA349_13650 [Halomonadaceae bacterium]